jgi:hypothetical protein
MGTTERRGRSVVVKRQPGLRVPYPTRPGFAGGTVKSVEELEQET